MNSVYVAKFIANLEKNANVTCVTFTNNAHNNRNTAAFEKKDLVTSMSQNK